jgi:AraC family transcriptional regulator, regulatory protein of adaptative response / DNA-3-methyladenine glycosylase II
MRLDPAACYRALSARDARFDGRFFVAVSSTRIYCRPICTVRRPRRENCRFFPSAAAAEAAGYRPCLRCRPELAPGNSTVDAVRRVAHGAARLLEDGAANGAPLDAVASRLGVTSRHLRRVFQSEFGVSPVAFLQTQRLLLAKRLLTDTALPATEIAFASGFGSLRRFNALVRTRYRLSPTGLRRAAGTRTLPDALVFDLAVRPPYDWVGVLSFLRTRAVPGVEAADASVYRRTLRIDRPPTPGWMQVGYAPRRAALRVVLSTSLVRAVPAALGCVKDLTDASCNPEEIAAALGDLGAAHPGVRVPGAVDGFEIAVRAILGQQVSLAAARRFACRFARSFGTPIETPFADLTTLFPGPGAIVDLPVRALAGCGMTTARARSILALARAVCDGALVLSPSADVDATVGTLGALPGVGDWTAQYIAMRALAWPDAFPAGDRGVLRAMRLTVPRRALEAAEAWRPWRAYAVMHLWRSLTDAPAP